MGSRLADGQPCATGCVWLQRLCKDQQDTATAWHPDARRKGQPSPGPPPRANCQRPATALQLPSVDAVGATAPQQNVIGRPNRIRSFRGTVLLGRVRSSRDNCLQYNGGGGGGEWPSLVHAAHASPPGGGAKRLERPAGVGGGALFCPIRPKTGSVSAASAAHLRDHNSTRHRGTDGGAEPFHLGQWGVACPVGRLRAFSLRGYDTAAPGAVVPGRCTGPAAGGGRGRTDLSPGLSMTMRTGAAPPAPSAPATSGGRRTGGGKHHGCAGPPAP